MTAPVLPWRRVAVDVLAPTVLSYVAQGAALPALVVTAQQLGASAGVAAAVAAGFGVGQLLRRRSGRGAGDAVRRPPGARRRQHGGVALLGAGVPRPGPGRAGRCRRPGRAPARPPSTSRGSPTSSTPCPGSSWVGSCRPSGAPGAWACWRGPCSPPPCRWRSVRGAPTSPLPSALPWRGSLVLATGRRTVTRRDRPDAQRTSLAAVAREHRRPLLTLRGRRRHHLLRPALPAGVPAAVGAVRGGGARGGVAALRADRGGGAAALLPGRFDHGPLGADLDRPCRARPSWVRRCCSSPSSRHRRGWSPPPCSSASAAAWGRGSSRRSAPTRPRTPAAAPSSGCGCSSPTSGPAAGRCSPPGCPRPSR